MSIKIILSVLSLAVVVSAAATTRKIGDYDGFLVIRAVPQSEIQYDAILELFYSDIYDFWKEPSFYNAPVDIMVSPEEYPNLKQFLDEHQITHSVLISNVGDLIRLEKDRQKSRKKAMDWEDYHTLPEVNQWLSNLVSGSANSSVTITSEGFGTSYEGREMIVYKVSSGTGSNKPAFWIDATIHAREHITTAVITYIINELVVNSTLYEDILENVDFYFLPFVNPDGYVYTHEVDRMWRKTRTNWTNSTCIGVDANRNFGFQWGFNNGSSNNPCSSGYRGPEPFSEPESQAVREYILSRNVSWQGFITLHSYAQLWLSPWGYTYDLPEYYTELIQVAKEATGNLTSYFGTEYVYGGSAEVLYATSGTSQDWARGEANIKYVYTIELRDQGNYGFLLPADQIKDTAIETWAGIQVVAKAIANENRI